MHQTLFQLDFYLFCRRIKRIPDGVVLLIAAMILLVGGELCAQTSEGVLGDLYLAREGGLAHYSSADSTGGNSDRWPVAPGETLVLMDHRGTGVIRRWWITIAPQQNTEILRHLIIRCFWDGESDPSVEVPVADFFGMGFGQWKDYISLPLNMTSGGYNAYWPMPFRESGRITVENTGSVPVQSLYYNIDVRTYDELPDDALYFHAQFRKTESAAGSPVSILETTGRGHYVGTLLSMQPRSGNHLGYLEGDELIYIDGEEFPSIVGTGTEDYFSSGWYYVTGEYSAPFHGVSIKDEDKGRINTYRWHTEDPIPFRESFVFRMEHGGTNDMAGVEYSSVAFWYQTHPHPPFPPLPLRLMPLEEMAHPTIEAELLGQNARITGGKLEVQSMEAFTGSEWGSGAQLWWTGASPGDRLDIPITVDAAGTYELIGYFTRAPDYGIIMVEVNGRRAGELIDGYAPEVQRSQPVSFGEVILHAGENIIQIELLGKDERSRGYSDGYLVGIDGFHLLK